MLLLMLSAIAGCSLNKDVSSKNPIKESNLLTNIETIDTMEILFDKTGGPMWSGRYEIIIKDKKIIQDIGSLINKSTLLNQEEKEAKAKKLSGGAKKDNKIKFSYNNDKVREFSFAYDSPPFEVGLLNFENKTYEIPYEAVTYMHDLSEHKSAAGVISDSANSIFKKYHWTADYKINSLREKLPSNLKHKAGEYPYKIYWAYNNELSKAIGLDMSEYLDKEVIVDIYRLRETLPDFMQNRSGARGIIVRHEDKIIGAFIDAGRHSSFACSLDRKSLENITKKPWDQWILSYMDEQDELENRLSKLTAEDIINEYIKALNEKNSSLAMACLSRDNIVRYLSMNMDNNDLYNRNEDIETNNIKSAKLVKMEKIKASIDKNDVMEYNVIISMEFVKVIIEDDGDVFRIIKLKKEGPKGAWKIYSMATG